MDRKSDLSEAEKNSTLTNIGKIISVLEIDKILNGVIKQEKKKYVEFPYALSWFHEDNQ